MTSPPPEIHQEDASARTIEESSPPRENQSPGQIRQTSDDSSIRIIDPPEVQAAARLRLPIWKFHAVSFYLLTSFVMGVSMYWFFGDQFSGGETYRIVDAVYFFIVTFSTVGYGDIVPLTVLAKILSVILVMNCVVSLEIFAGWVVDPVLQVQQRVTTVINNNGGNSKRCNLLSALSCVFLCVLIGFIFLHFHGGYGHVDSIYLSVITVSTVGYGDLGFRSCGGKVFAAAWIAASTVAMACVLTRFGEMRTGTVMQQPSQKSACNVKQLLKDGYVIALYAKDLSGLHVSRQRTENGGWFLHTLSTVSKRDPAAQFITAYRNQDQVIVGLRSVAAGGLLMQINGRKESVFASYSFTDWDSWILEGPLDECRLVNLSDPSAVLEVRVEILAMVGDDGITRWMD